MTHFSKLLLSLLATTLFLASCGDDEVTVDDAEVIEEGEDGSVGDDAATGDDTGDGAAEDDPNPDDDGADGSEDEAPLDDGATDEVVLGEDAYILLNGNGIDTDLAVASFGDDAESVLTLSTFYWGEPTSDSGDQPVGPDCLASGDSFRRVLYDETELLFVDGLFSFWFTSQRNQNTEAFVGDETTISIIPQATSVGDLRANFGNDISIEDEPPLGPSFFLEDNFGELRGEVTDLDDSGIVLSVNSGIGCGE